MRANNFIQAQMESDEPDLVLAGKLTWEQLVEKQEELIMFIPFKAAKLVDEYPRVSIWLREDYEEYLESQELISKDKPIEPTECFKVILSSERALWDNEVGYNVSSFFSVMACNRSFYADGMRVISRVLADIDYLVPIELTHTYNY